MGWNPETGEFDPDYEDANAPDLSVLHRWELLHMISAPIGLGAKGRVLSVLFRVLPPGRTLFMSWKAVAREAGVDRSTVARTYADLRALGMLVTAKNGKPAIDYLRALDAAIRSITARPPAERERRLVRLQAIAEALGKNINLDFIVQRDAIYAAEPGQKPHGRLKRTQIAHRAQRATTPSQRATPWSQAATTPSQRAPRPVATCDPELVSNGISDLNPELKLNGSSEDGASRARARMRLDEHDGVRTSSSGGIQATYGGRPTLKVKVLRLLETQNIVTRLDVIADCHVSAGEAQRALKGLTGSGHAERVAHGKYRLAAAPEDVGK